MRNSPVSQAIYKRHIALYRFLNNTWILTDLQRPELKKRAAELRASTSKAKRRYAVPKKGRAVESRRTDADIGQVYRYQYERGIFENHIVGIVSRVEAFIQECMKAAILAFPKKLSLICDKNGIPVDLFLEHEDRGDLLARFIAMRCESLMFGKPLEYLEKAAAVLSIDLQQDLIKDYIEIKASRDIIIHNSGTINRLYVDKAGDERRGEVGDELKIDKDYFRHVIVAVKALSGAIQRETERVYH